MQAVRERAQRELTAMSIKMGELQGQMMRLEAFGQRLAEWQILDDGEFMFDTPLPVGGPEANLNEWPVVTDHNILDELDQMLVQLEDRQNQLHLLESVMVNHHIEEATLHCGASSGCGLVKFTVWY